VKTPDELKQEVMSWTAIAGLILGACVAFAAAWQACVQP
jgi:hypothetical protein